MVKSDYLKYLTFIFGIMTVIVKFAAGVISASVFVVVSAFYSLSAFAAKTVCRVFSDRESSCVYFVVAGITFAAAMFYFACAIKELTEPSGFAFGLIPAIALAAVSFADIAAAVKEYIGVVKSKKGLDIARRRMDVCKAVAAIALTQTALIAVNEGGEGLSFYIPTGIIAAAAMTISSLLTMSKGIAIYLDEKRKNHVPEDGEK